MNILNKTQHFKSKILPLSDCESDIIHTSERLTLFDGENQLVISFIFDAYYLYDGWVAINCLNFEIPHGTMNKEEIMKFINVNYCTVDEFSDYFGEIYDATWESANQ